MAIASVHSCRDERASNALHEQRFERSRFATFLGEFFDRTTAGVTRTISDFAALRTPASLVTGFGAKRPCAIPRFAVPASAVRLSSPAASTFRARPSKQVRHQG
jgi:hypothetical protein